MTTLLDSPVAELPLTTSAVSGSEALEALREEWNHLAAEAPVRQHEWLATWWGHFAEPGDRLAVVTVRDAEGALVGLAPWYAHRSRWGRVTLAFLGSRNVATDYATILAAPGRETEVVEAVAAWLMRREIAWDWLELSGVAAADTAIAVLYDRLQAAGAPLRRDPGPQTWRINLPATWDADAATLGKSRREKLRRMYRQNFDSGRCIVHTAVDEASFERAFQVLVDLHQRRRRDAGDAGCFADPRFTRFLHEAAAKLLARDQLRLLWLELEGRPIAVEFDYVGAGVEYRYQAGIEPEAYDERPGWLSVMWGIRRAINEGLTAFDFMRGDEPYKANWRAQPIPSIELRAVWPSVSNRVWFKAWEYKRSLKRWLKARLRPAAPAEPAAD